MNRRIESCVFKQKYVFIVIKKKKKMTTFFVQKLLFMCAYMGITSGLFIFPTGFTRKIYVISRSTFATSKIRISQLQFSPTANALPGVAR